MFAINKHSSLFCWSVGFGEKKDFLNLSDHTNYAALSLHKNKPLTEIRTSEMLEI
jgi:hypothetical protein